MGFFDIKKPFNEDKIGIVEKVQYLEEDYNMTKKAGIKSCSYCKHELGVGANRNLRRCVNKTMMGKSKFNSWNPGFYKLMHIGDLEVIDLCRDANVFTFTTSSNDSIRMSLYNDDIQDYHDDKPLSLLNNEYEHLENDMTNLLKNCGQIISKSTINSRISDFSEHPTTKDN